MNRRHDHSELGRRRWLWAWPMLLWAPRYACAESAPIPDAPLARSQDEPPVQPCVEVWVLLSLPPVAARAAETAPQRAQALRDIDAQQAEVMARLLRLGAVERGRVRLARNALAVAVPNSALDEVRQLPGVTGVRRVMHRNRIQVGEDRGLTLSPVDEAVRR